MRIVLDLQSCQASNRHRGIGRYSVSLAKAMLRNAGSHDFRIVLNDGIQDTAAPILQAFEGLISPDHVTTFDVPVSVAEIDIANAWRVRAAERIREATLLQLQPDLVHVSSLFEGLADNAVTSTSAFWPAAARFDTAATLYDLIPLLRQNMYLTDIRAREWYFRKLQALKNSEVVLAISSHSRLEALSALQLPLHQIVNMSAAVDDIFVPRSSSTEEQQALKTSYGLTRPFAMYTGGIDSRKNIEGLVDAFSRLPANVRTSHQLAIVCNIQEDDRARLLRHAKQLGLQTDALVLTGFVSDADLVALYNAATLFVFPSLHEGFGLPALEAMSCGVATIGSNTTSIPEVIGRQDALFDPTDIDDIARKMHEVLINDALRASLQTHGLQQAQSFSWDASAKIAIGAFEEAHSRRPLTSPVVVCADLSVETCASATKKPLLAFISPLPPAQSGIADYSAQLIPELARFYDIEMIIDQPEITGSWILANFPIRSAKWFFDHGDRYERVVYHFGNSDFHSHMFDLLKRHPGVVVLHDFFLSGIVNHLEHTTPWPNAFCRSLYESHGYAALLDEHHEGRVPTIYRYPCNKSVLDHAEGIIVHSAYSTRLADQWYGPGSADNWRVIPLLKAMPASKESKSARKLLGFGEDDFLVCTFGHMGATKLNDRLLNAWLKSPLALDQHCHLIFVGASDGSNYRDAIQKTIQESDCKNRIRITGFTTPEIYHAYLSGTDIAVQLRDRSRGETSAAILDCLSYGLATIVNANGPASELPDDVLIKLPDVFPQSALTDALTSLWTDDARKGALGKAARSLVEQNHQPSSIGNAYRSAIEDFSAAGHVASTRQLLKSIGSIEGAGSPSQEDIDLVAGSINTNLPAGATRQLLIDITALLNATKQTPSLERARDALRALIEAPPAGYRIEPFYVADTGKTGRRYARQFTLSLIGRSDLVMEDSIVEVRRSDRIVQFKNVSAQHQSVKVENVVHTCGWPGLDCDAQNDENSGLRQSCEAITNYLLKTLDVACSAARNATQPNLKSIGKLSTSIDLKQQLLVDITMLANGDEKSGIQRVVRSVLNALLEAPPDGLRVLPVRDVDGQYVHASRHSLNQIHIDNPSEAVDAPVELSAGDIFLGLDLSPNHVPKNLELYAEFRRRKVAVFFVVYDLLPIRHPEMFNPGASPWFVDWLNATSTAGDGLICISKAVSDDLIAWLGETHPDRIDKINIGYFHLGADIAASAPSRGLSIDANETLARINRQPSFLMVGTLEPRKSHEQALSAFEKLWETGVDAALVIVGKQGWMVESLASRLRTHPENGRRLFWLPRVSDEMLLKLYATCSALLSASIAEGFGLPLIEAAIQKLPIITRDLPVFREVCGEHAYYFVGNTGSELATAILEWMALAAVNKAPQSISMPHLSWSQSATQLTDVILRNNWYRPGSDLDESAVAQTHRVTKIA